MNDVASLESELRETRERLRATVEEYETALEELKSGNEELHTVNNELAAKVDGLNRTNADLRNLLDSTQIATVFLERDKEHQRTLVGELNHRVRNMLQMVIGLANQTLHRCESLKQFEAAFMGRMQALARAYDLVSRQGWHKVQIAELLRAQLGPFASEGGRYTAQGESIMLTANAALALGLVVYELATNATKYGALSVPDGHIDVSWQLRDREDKQVLRFHWRERGGPKVTPPAHHGFGSELVQRQLRYELNGRAAMEFTQEGLEVTVEIPAAGALAAVAPA